MGMDRSIQGAALRGCAAVLQFLAQLRHGERVCLVRPMERLRGTRPPGTEVGGLVECDSLTVLPPHATPFQDDGEG